MALFDDVLEGGIGTGLVAALGVAVLAPVAKPVLRSAAKWTIRGGIMAYDFARHQAAELGEMASDLAAESRAEASGGSGHAPPRGGSKSG